MVLGGGQGTVIDSVTHLGLKKDNPYRRSRSCSHIDAFYRPTGSDFDAKWRCLEEQGAKGANVEKAFIPSMSDVFKQRELVRKPVKVPPLEPSMRSTQFPLMEEKEQFMKSREAEQVMSAPILPKKFPTDAKDIVYPTIEKQGVDNPLFMTGARSYGSKKPMKHQLPDYYFPRNNTWTSSYTDCAPRNNALMSRPSYSKFHEDRDIFR